MKGLHTIWATGDSSVPYYQKNYEWTKAVCAVTSKPVSSPSSS